MGTFRIISSLLVFIVVLSSCNSPQSLTGTTSYEDDEVYYQPGETFITDVQTSASASSSSSPSTDNSSSYEDDYYSGESQNGGVVNNYYGDVYQGGWGGNSWARPGGRMVWDPIWGWRISYGFGNGFYSGWSMGYGYGNGWGYNGWYDPFYDPWYNNWGWYGGYGYNPYWGYPSWNNPWYWNTGYNNPWAWNDNSSGGLVFGHRPSLSSGTSLNSGFTTGPRRTRALFDTPSNTVSPAIPGGRKLDSPNVVNRPSNDRSKQEEEYNFGRPDRTVVPPRNPETQRPVDRGRTDQTRPARERDNSPKVRPERNDPPRPAINNRDSAPAPRPSTGGGGSRGGGNSGGGNSGGGGGTRRR